MLHDRTEAGQLVPPHAGRLLLLLADDLPPDLPAQGQLPTLGRLYLPEDGEDLVPGQVGEGLFILLEGGREEGDRL